MANRKLVILSRISDKDGALAPLGTRKEVEGSLVKHNTSAERVGSDVLYGPGIELQLPPNQDPITQMLLTLTDEDIAWPVIIKLARDLQWKVHDPGSGRELSLKYLF